METSREKHADKFICQFSTLSLFSRYLQDFSDRLTHETTNAYDGNKHMYVVSENFESYLLSFVCISTFLQPCEFKQKLHTVPRNYFKGLKLSVLQSLNLRGET